MASSKAVKPPVLTEIRLFCRFSYFDVKPETRLNRSLKLISRNSSWGFDVLKNCETASLDFWILSDIDQLESKIRPTEMGVSSVENETISCSTYPSNTRKLLASRPVTTLSEESVTVTFRSTIS